MLKTSSSCSRRLRSALLIISLVLSTALTPFLSSQASAASLTIPLTIRPANSTELSQLNTQFGATVLAQNGANINHSLNETYITGDAHTGRAWVAEGNPQLSECDQNVQLSITGNYQILYVANSSSNPPHPSDGPELGAIAITTDGSLVAPAGGTGDAIVGTSYPFSLAPTATTVAAVNSGFRLLAYAETYDYISQHGTNASFTYMGIPSLNLTYDDSSCPPAPVLSPDSTNVPGAPKTGALLGATVVAVTVLSTVLLITVIFKKKHLITKQSDR